MVTPDLENQPVEEAPEKKMLLDYYRRTVGTPMQMPYEEMVIYTYDDDSLLLEVYTNGDTKYEYVQGYRIPKEAYERVLKIIKKYRMQKWDKLKGNGLCGVVKAVRFYMNGEYYRASTDHMPDNGMSAFYDVSAAMGSYVQKDRLIYERYVHGIPEEELIPRINSEEELLSYKKTTGLTKDTWSDCFTLSYGMGAKDAKGQILDHVEYYVIAFLKPGYYPCPDLHLNFSYTAVRREGETREEGEVSFRNEWYYDYSEHLYRAHPVAYQEFATFRAVTVDSVEGSIAYFEIPEELVHEDDNGKYFLYRNRYTRYYLDGSAGTEMDGRCYPDHKVLWLREILNREILNEE